MPYSILKRSLIFLALFTVTSAPVLAEPVSPLARSQYGIAQPNLEEVHVNFLNPKNREKQGKKKKCHNKKKTNSCSESKGYGKRHHQDDSPKRIKREFVEH